jgi:hypothetical protein
MSDWKRTTREVHFESMRPELMQAIKAHIEQYNLGAVLSDALICVQTDSEKTKKSLFGGTEIVYTGAVLTPHWIFSATSGTKTKAAVLSAQLHDVTVQDYAQTSFAKMIPDSGINIEGRFTDVSENISAFIGLDDNAGKKFKEAVIKAAQEAKK